MKLIGRSLVGLASVAITLLAVYLIVHFFSEWFSHIKSTDKPAAITALGLIVVAVITYLFNRGADRRRVLEELTRKEKIELYESIVTFLMKMLVNAPSVSAPTEDETLDFFANATPQLITYGSNSVVKQWGKYIRGIPTLQAKGEWELLIALEHLLKAMRKDIGHSSVSLMDGDLARLFITDIDETIAERKKLRARGRKLPTPNPAEN